MDAFGPPFSPPLLLPGMLPVCLAVIGLIAGSFIGLVSFRLPRGENFVTGRSRCDACGTRLSPASLVPLVSYLASGGRCATCAAPIPRRYPLIELAAAGIGVWAALAEPTAMAASLTALLGWQLLLISLIDGEHFWLPDGLTWPLAATGLGAAFLLGRPAVADSLIGGVAGFGTLWLLAWVYRRVRGRDGLGGGDPFLLGAGGAWVGWAGLPGILLWASATGLSLVAAKVLTGGRVSGSDRLPFGPCLAVGIWATWLLTRSGGGV